MPNTKILVNFKKRKVIHTEHHAGSAEYKTLINKGYELVGTMKPEPKEYLVVSRVLPVKIQAYWDPAFFDPEDKYFHQKNPKPNQTIGRQPGD